MPSIIDISFKININVLCLAGLYLPDKFKSLYRVYTYLVYVFIVIPVPTLGCVYLLAQEKITFRQIADNLFLIAELGCFIPKYWPLVRHAERIKRCIHYFSAPIFKTDRKEHQEILDDCIKVCHQWSAFYFASVTAGFVSWSIRPISWENHILPTDIWLPFDPHTASSAKVASVYFYLVLGKGFGLGIKILKNNLQHLGEYVDEELASLEPCRKAQLTYQKIRQCVIHHEHILAFVEEYEECFSQVALSQFVGAVVIFCVSCLQLTIVEVVSLDFLAMMMYFIAMLCQVYLYCHFGTILYDESDTISDAIYLSKWYEFDKRSKKALCILMERLKRPMTVTCGKIFTMSLVTFTMILRRAYSLLAVLENYNIELN
ncbi:odorant receptor 70 [Tribolium castaneum]|uniref:Odorant receptor n=1 Tax=Tribolium castaneum TaxID=7070 RepID=D6WBW4_TRICA|nr:odorant receptor 70 [Tribolium castaneum]